jgi:hypothetical protein
VVDLVVEDLVDGLALDLLLVELQEGALVHRPIAWKTTGKAEARLGAFASGTMPVL